MSAKPTADVATDLRVVIGKLRRRMRESADPGDFTPSQAAALLRLESGGPATVTALAEAEGVRPQSMGATIAVLVAGGQVSAAPDPHDGRRTILSLTDAFRAEVLAGRAAREDWLSQVIESRLTPEERQQLAVGVELLTRLVQPEPRSTP